MSKRFTYTVREGDTVQDLSSRFYGVPSDYPKIVNANPSIAAVDLAIFPGQILNIPAKQVLNQERIENDSGEDDIVVEVDGIKYENVWNFSLKKTIDKAADSFVFEIPFDPKDLKIKFSFLPFHYPPVLIFIGGVLRFTGIVVNIFPTIGTNKRILKVSGYSTCGVMNDCMLPTSAYPPVFQTSTFFDICQTVASAFNIKVFDAVGDNNPFEEVDIKPTDKVYSFLSKLAKKRGVLLTSDVEGNLIIQRTTNEKATFTFEEGEPDITGITASYKGQKGFTTYTGLVDAKDILGPIGDDDSAEVTNEFMQSASGPRPFVFEVDEIEEGSIREATEAKLRRSLVDMVSYNIVVKGWRDPTGKLWTDNLRMNVKYPSVMIYRTTEFLISFVDLQKDSDKKITQMTLILPQSYNTEEIENVPWLE